MERFWNKVERVESGCWEWQGYRQSSGHGRFRLDGEARGAHRVSWLLTNGEIPHGMQVCHHCDNPPCVNPAHLFLGTQADNIADMMRKGRHKAPARITEEDVAAIRRACNLGMTQGTIAQQFGISQSQVSLIANRRRWRHIAE